ncbi:MAG: endonuclease [Deltaproteobacteria bacterium]|nr:endonuclease [Deltaproteobacteria bacterium]
MGERDEFEGFLRQTLDDDRLSRAERSVVHDWLDEHHLDEQDRLFWVNRAFALASERLFDGRDERLLGWLEDLIKLLMSDRKLDSGKEGQAEAYFLPDSRAVGRLRGLLQNCRKRLEICVFTITNDELSTEVLAAHKRGVRVRVITDDEKSHDLGSDVGQFRKAGIEVRMDGSPFHMHHKFAVFDARLMLTGSFNWTRSAAQHNQESFIVSDDPVLVSSHLQAFDALWERFDLG